MHVAPPEVHPWTASRLAWQSVFLPHAAAGFAQTLSMQAPQSVPPNGGAAGGELAAEDSAVALGSVFSADGAEDAESAAFADAETSDFSELELEELSSAGLSAGFDPPPQASQTAGAEANKMSETTRKRRPTFMALMH
jgi:hypothetical protein